MEYLCTTCSREKRVTSEPLPAVERYQDPRIAFVVAESQRLGRPLLILSGRFGLLDSDERIPWYDHALGMEEVDALVPTLEQQFLEKRVTSIVFYAHLKITPGWRPYFDVLEKACHRQGVRLQIHTLTGTDDGSHSYRLLPSSFSL